MLEPRDLRCGSATTPLGLDTARPVLSWQLASELRGQQQRAFQVQAASSRTLLSQEAPDLWDSGKVFSPKQAIAYGGPKLRSGQRVWWRVCVWDREDNPSACALPTWFEMGLLAPDDWQADWIGMPAAWHGRALYFRRAFKLDQAVARARAYVVGLGYYELSINGRKVGDHVLDPGTTRYDRRVLYVTHDVTPFLWAGENMVGAIVGHGWYGAPKLLLQMDIELKDGTSTQILSRSGPWQVGTGPIVAHGVYDGERYDARLERPGWDLPDSEPPAPGQAAGGGDVEPTAVWARPHTVDPPGGRLVAQMLEPIRVVRSLPPQDVREPRPSVFVYDLGQNIAGWVKLRACGPRGIEIRLTYAETLRVDGTVNQENLRAAAATDAYILRGDPDGEAWEPRFTYHGFRYVQVEGYPGTPGPGAITGRLVRSATASVSEFTSGHELLNRIDRLVWWTEATNQHSIPTDCPQRDERMGWLNDLGARTEEALYNFDLARFFAKWVADIHDAQDPATGAITDTAPFRWGNRPADPVSVSYLLIPWMLYVHYGDRLTMATHFDGFRAWVNYLTTRSRDHILDYSYYGDWAPPVRYGKEGTAVSRDTPGALISTGYHYYAARLLARMALVLGQSNTARAYRALAADIAAAYHAQFYDPQTRGYGSNNQACNAFSLYMELVPEPLRHGVISNLVDDVVALHDCHLTTGNLCTKYLLEVLTETGHADVAYRVVTQRTYPSWGYMLDNGATTVWERWELETGSGMNSHNHPMYASVGSWLYKSLAGINPDPTAPGFAGILIRPHVIADVGHVDASLSTCRGTVRSAWALDGDVLKMNVTIPTGSMAKVSVPRPQAGAPCRIYEGNSPVWERRSLGELAWLDSIGTTEAAVTLTVGSGTYSFTREPV